MFQERYIEFLCIVRAEDQLPGWAMLLTPLLEFFLLLSIDI